MQVFYDFIVFEHVHALLVVKFCMYIQLQMYMCIQLCSCYFHNQCLRIF